MKNRLTFTLRIVCLLMISQSIIAQKGRWLTEGNIGNLIFSNGNNTNTAGICTNESKSKIVNVALYPTIGYFITDKFVIGGI